MSEQRGSCHINARLVTAARRAFARFFVTGFRSHGPRAGLMLAVFGLVSACARTAPPHRSALQEKIGKEGISATQLRLRLYEMPTQLGAQIEAAADQIRAKSSDPVVRRRALLWKTDGIPMLYVAALRPDPLAGSLDLWVYLEQMDLYFREGAGKNAFGEWQTIATDTLARMLADTERTSAMLTTERDIFERRKSRIGEFAHAHPIEGAFSSRQTAMLELASLSDVDRAGVIASVGAAEETLSDISLRLNAYATFLPKVANWQAELAAEDIVEREDVSGALAAVQAAGEAALRGESLLADIPGIVRQANAPIEELLDRQRAELMSAIERERLAMAAFVAEERAAFLAALDEERKAATASVSQERAAALAAIDAMARRSIDDASDRARGMIDYAFVRALFLVVAAALLFTAGAWLARGHRRRDNGASGMRP